MSTDTTARPVILLATVDYNAEGKVVLLLQNEDRTSVEYELHPLGGAMLSLTLVPALKQALAAEKAKHPEKFERGGFPDTPEGL